MRVQVRSRDVEVTGDLRGHVERRLAFALGRFTARIGLVIVRISRRGVALDTSVTHCQIDVSLRPRHVEAEDLDADIRAAVNHAAHRVSRSVARLLDQENER
jgi:ribosomal subunit interface protein